MKRRTSLSAGTHMGFATRWKSKVQFAFLDNEGLALHSWFALNNRQVSALSKSPRRQRIDAGQKSASGKSLGRVVGMSDLCLRVRPMDRDLDVF